MSNASIYTEPGQHYHCPNDCEKPQPSRDGERVLCGRYLHEGRGEFEVFLCTPVTCPEDV